ncbi:hypothetical protein Tco_0049301, partial [Tanacetum coccineum]
MNEEKSQPSPIFKIAVDILKQTNFFRAFTASSTIPSIYIQQFWDTVCFDSKVGNYKCQLDEQWDELTQYIHSDTEDKRNLAQHTLGKKKATLILIPSNLKFSAKGTKQEVFGMTIPNELINDVIRGSDYYDAYLEKVAKHQRHLAGKEVSDPESPAPKPAKPTKQAKPKATKQPTVSKTTTKQLNISKTKAKKPKPAPAKPQEKKRKLVSESSEAPPLAKRTKVGKVVKKITVKISKQLVDEFADEGVPTAKPSFEDTEEAIL